METQPLKTERGGRWPLVALAALVAAQLVLFGLYGAEKAGFHMDEIVQYNLANSYNSPFMRFNGDLYGQWHSGDYFWGAVTVEPQHRFAYGAVVNNQRWDVHPPLSYLLLHTICSLMPGQFSKWQGLGLNLAYFAGANLLLYRLGRRLTARLPRGRWLALGPCLWWGFSSAAATTAMYIRMYMLATLLAVWIVLCGLRLATREQWGRGLYAAAFFSAFLGFMTHYYTLIVLFFVWLALAAALLLQKRGGLLLRATLCYLAAGAAGVAVFYSAAYQILFGYRGAENLGNFFDFSTLPGNLAAVASTVNSRLFGGLLWPLLAVPGLAALVLWVSGRRVAARQAAGERPSRRLRAALARWAAPAAPQLSAAMVAAPTLGYLLAVTKVAPVGVLRDAQDGARYLTLVFPLLALLAFYALAALAARLWPRGGRAVPAAACLLLAAALGWNSLNASGAGYLYTRYAEDRPLLAARAKLPLFAIFHTEGYIVMQTIPDITLFEQVYCVTLQQERQIAEQLKARGITGPVLLMASRSWVNEGPSRMDALLADTGYTRAGVVLRRDNYTLYELN
jgi:hypothetical protein